MTTRSRGPMAGFGWLKDGVSTGYRHPKAMLGGAALLLLAAVLPSLVTVPWQLYAQLKGAPLSPTAIGLMMAGSILFGLLIVPLYAGYLQVIDAAERGLPARALDIFKPYREGDALRFMGFGLAIIIVYIAIAAVILAATGGAIVSWYVQVLGAQASHLPPPGFPKGFAITVVLFVALGIFMSGFYAISLGQVALRGRSVFGAVSDGLIGALKNLMPLTVFMLTALLVWIGVVIVIVIAALLLALVAKLISGWFVLVVVVPLYIAMLLSLFTVMFGVAYHLWRDVCGDDIVASLAQPLAA